MAIISSSDPIVGQHIKHYRQILANRETKLSELEPTYVQLRPLIHFRAPDTSFDADGFSYASTRLPANIYQVKRIIITSKLNIDARLFEIKPEYKVTSINRRRIMYLDNSGVLLVLINSYSDLDDFINNLIAFGIEYRKIKSEKIIQYPEILNFEQPVFNPTIQLLPVDGQDFVVQARKFWQNNISKSLYLGLSTSPVFFVSSNTHSLANIIGGFLNSKKNYIFDFVARNHSKIYDAWFASKIEHDQVQVNDFLYYLSEKFLSANQQFVAEKDFYEKRLGIIKLTSTDTLPIDLQIIPLQSLYRSSNLDPLLSIQNLSFFSNHPALIVNIQYPLGVAAKYLLDAFIETFSNIQGVYIIGKAAILNGTVGDIQIPNIVHDEITNNVYQFSNIFNQQFVHRGVISKILTDQKAACVYGTLLENLSQIENYRKSNFNIIEMESGHYLASIVEHYLLHGTVSNSTPYNLPQLPFDFGIINYASDNPLTENLSHESIDFRGIETTYLSSINVLQRILDVTAG